RQDRRDRAEVAALDPRPRLGGDGGEVLRGGVEGEVADRPGGDRVVGHQVVGHQIVTSSRMPIDPERPLVISSTSDSRVVVESTATSAARRPRYITATRSLTSSTSFM